MNLRQFFITGEDMEKIPEDTFYERKEATENEEI